MKFLAGGLGFEPRLTESESAVLPLDDPPKLPIGQKLRNFDIALKQHLEPLLTQRMRGRQPIAKAGFSELTGLFQVRCQALPAGLSEPPLPRARGQQLHNNGLGLWI